MKTFENLINKTRYNHLCAFLDELNIKKVIFENEVIEHDYDIEELTISRLNDNHYLILNKLVIKNKNEGNGTHFMEDLCHYCDDNKKILCVTPDTAFGASSVTRLKTFYKKFGFIENKGKHQDFTHREAMYRLPE